VIFVSPALMPGLNAFDFRYCFVLALRVDGNDLLDFADCSADTNCTGKLSKSAVLARQPAIGDKSLNGQALV